jgi:NAD(P)-dependent dehydrogenase (short-subunit alcohol dehydrogenase family)
MQLSGKKIVIFGGGSGIGYAAAELAHAGGAVVTIADANSDAASVPLVANGSCQITVCDVTDPAAVMRVLRDAATSDGRLDGVVSTVGGARVRPDLGIDMDYWSQEMRINLTSAYIVAASAIEIMRPAGVGSIVMTSSSFALSPGPDRVAYSAAKAGVIGLMKSLAAATARLGLRINCVAPGLTDTPRVREMSGSPETFAEWAAAKPQGRIATPNEVAFAILFLLSDAARSMTGQVVHVNNGSLMP